MNKLLYRNRYEIFLISQSLILFSSLLISIDLYEKTFLPILFLLNISAGINLLSEKKILMWVFIAYFIISVIIFGTSLFLRQGDGNILLRLSVYFVFHITVTWEIIRQVFNAEIVNKNVIIGLMSGYISLGFLAFFLFMAIELTHPGAFQGTLIENDNPIVGAEGLMYYAFITLLTIGYGDIVPAIPLAQKAAILVGLTGQFYMAIITAVVIEKYIRHSAKNQ